MNKKIFSMLICLFLLLGITGCKSNKINNNSTDTNNDSEITTDNIKDEAKEVIYQFNKHIQNKDAKSMAELFNENYMVTKDKLYYNREELQEKFEQVFESDSYKSYNITDVHKITNKNEFNKYFKDSSEVDYENSILKVAKVFGDDTIIYIADVKYNDESSQDIIYVTKDNGSYIIERTTVWSYMMAYFRNNFSLNQ